MQQNHQLLEHSDRVVSHAFKAYTEPRSWSYV